MAMADIFPDKFYIEKSYDIINLLDNLNNVIKQNTVLVESIASELVDTEFLEEIKSVVNCGSADVYFGKTLRELKIIMQDDDGLRDHEIYLQYRGLRKLTISKVNLPHSSLQTREYRSLGEVIETFKKYINDLANYFYQVENIDQFCTIMEPAKASFKDDYRRILLDDRTWLHVEITPEGLATNIHLVGGQSAHWHNKLQSGLLNWDHDKNIVENILTIFDLEVLPQLISPISEPAEKVEDLILCGICLCAELPEDSAMPQPLCQNVSCGVYYHRNCLYQWLVACAGSRPPAFGVATGACPTCLQPITCSEKDN